MKQAVLFIVTNGVGLGHLTRGLAVALEMRRLHCNKEIVFFTTSIAVDVIRQCGFPFYTIPSREQQKYRKESEWNHQFATILSRIFKQYQISTIIFDGAYPFAPLLNSYVVNPSVRKVWIKREGDKAGFELLATIETLFDCSIVPGEFQDTVKKIEKKNKRYINPILLNPFVFERKEPLRSQFHIPLEKKIMYLQLGAGAINEIKEPIKHIVSIMDAMPQVVLVVAESIIGKQLIITGNEIIRLKEYPNARYFSEIDFAVSAAGYNTFHELMYYKVPTVFIPNLVTSKDDQKKRAMRAVRSGCAYCACNKNELEISLKRLIKEENTIRKKLNQVGFQNGATDAASIIIKEFL